MLVAGVARPAVRAITCFSPAFTPGSVAASLAGGSALGAVTLAKLRLNGNVLGISGIAGGLTKSGVRAAADAPERVAFVLGLIAAGVVGATRVAPPVPIALDVAAVTRMLGGGILVGYGTALGSGCTSGHGIFGNARGSSRSRAATAAFMLAGMLVATLSNSSAWHAAVTSKAALINAGPTTSTSFAEALKASRASRPDITSNTNGAAVAATFTASDVMAKSSRAIKNLGLATTTASSLASCVAYLGAVAGAGFLVAFALQACVQCVVAIAGSYWTRQPWATMGNGCDESDDYFGTSLGFSLGTATPSTHGSQGAVDDAANTVARRSAQARARARVAVEALCGFCFGAALVGAGVADQKRVAGFLDWSGGRAAWDPTVGLVMASAIGIAAPSLVPWSRRLDASEPATGLGSTGGSEDDTGSVRSVETSLKGDEIADRFALLPRKPALAEAYTVPKLASSRPDAKLVSGSLLFGAGWGLAGLCPGPALVNLGAAAARLWVLAWKRASSVESIGSKAAGASPHWPILLFNAAMFAGFALYHRVGLVCTPES